VKISWRESEFECSNCGRPFPGSKLDRRLWCPDCRAVVIRRATLAARIIAMGVSLLLAVWIVSVVGPAPRFLVMYVIMVVAAYFFLYKLTQRVAFEIIRGRGVPPPTRNDDE
jgi:DNA-directed RNA polymerase subunit RPC12/RpoP